MPRATRLIVRLIYRGCTNRKFYHISLMRAHEHQHLDPPIEQLGVYDALPNEFNERVVSLNLNRLKYWMAQGADFSKPVAKLLGLSGFLPIHPMNYYTAWRARSELKEAQARTEAPVEADAEGTVN